MSLWSLACSSCSVWAQTVEGRPADVSSWLFGRKLGERSVCPLHCCLFPAGCGLCQVLSGHNLSWVVVCGENSWTRSLPKT